MAGNQYDQRWPQNPAPNYRRDEWNDQRQWQDNGRGQRAHNQEYQQYNEYPQSRSGRGAAGPTPQQRGYEHNQHWQGQAGYPQQDDYGVPSYDNGHGYTQPQQPQQEYYDQHAQPGRQYQYDDRYRSNGHGRPAPPEQNSSNGSRGPRDQWSQPGTPQKRSRPKERILKEPSSPKNLAWDNPFGAFPPKHKDSAGKERTHERQGSLDHGMASLDMKERPSSGGPRHPGSHDSRPRTSNGHRGDMSRPGTSHDRRPDMNRPPRGPPQGYPSPPSDRSPPQMDYQQPPAPVLPGTINSPRLRPSAVQGQPPRPGPPPGQQLPMNPGRPRPDRAPASYGPGDDYIPRPSQDSQSSYPAMDSRRNNHMHEDGYASDYNPQARAPRPLMDDNRTGTPARSPPHQNSYRGLPSGPAPVKSRQSNDMPNFDAIPNDVNERTEDPLITNQALAFDQKIYRRPTYEPEQPSRIDTSKTTSPPLDQTTSPLAEFSFDLPNQQQPMAPGRMEHPRRAATFGQTEMAPSGAGYGVQVDQPGPGTPTKSQFPPRSASRNGMKPNDIVRPPMPPNGQQPYRSFSQDQYPNRPHTSNAQRPPLDSYGMMNPYDQDRAPSAPVPSPYDQSRGPPGQSFQPPMGRGAPPRAASQDNYSHGPPQPFAQAPPPLRPAHSDGYNPGAPAPNGMTSAHPVPVRHYPNTNTNVNPKLNNNPDALPAHPTPQSATRNGSNSFQGSHPQQQAPPQSQRRDVLGPAPALTKADLDNLRQQYTNRPMDHALGLKLAKTMVEAAKVLSDESGTADPRTTQKNREKYIFDAHKLIKKLVGSSYPDAMFFLADCYGQGMLGLAVDAKEAFTLYQSAAKLNHPQSAYRVAVCCELGSEDGGGTRRDPLKAMQWYKRAATLGDTPAMYKMGMVLLKGLLGQQKNPREAVSWLKRAAERADKDNPHGLHELGLLYESPTPPDNIVKDERYAFQLFAQAAELGYKYSQFRLGSAYEFGLLGCPIDARQSIAWYTRAAAQGEHQSELALSGWYLTGSEPLLTQSDTEAFLWARKAASSGLAKAEYAMGYFNEVGIGTSVDVEEAKRWYYRAASQNFNKARERLEELKRGGQKQQKTRVSRSNINRQSDGECSVM